MLHSKSPYMRLIVRILANAGAVWIASEAVPGIVFTGTPSNLLIAGAVFGLMNSFVKPLVNLLSFPFILLTFGLFHFLINIALFLLAVRIVPDLRVEGFWAVFWGIVIISAVNHIISSFYRHRHA